MVEKSTKNAPCDAKFGEYGLFFGECLWKPDRETTVIKDLRAEQAPLEDAQRLVFEFVNHYNMVRLHSAIGYITPADKLAGRADTIWAARRQKLAVANAKRRAKAKETNVA